MTYVTLDTRFFIHVFIGFAITSLMLTVVLIYEVNRVYETNGKLWQKINQHSSVDDLWSHDPDLMEGLALLRGRRSEGSGGYVTLTQITFNDSCFGFLWSKFHMEKIVKYTVQVSSVNDPLLAPMEAVLSGLTTEYSLCGLNVSSAYWVNLTAHGQNAGASESAFGIMWTTHQVPPPPAAINVLDVTERTITITIPEIVLTKGPLSGIEVRIIMRAKVPLPESKESPWANVLSREKRSAENAGQPNLMIRTVELPTYLFSPHKARLDVIKGDAQKLNKVDSVKVKNSVSSDLGNTSSAGHMVDFSLKTAEGNVFANDVTSVLSVVSSKNLSTVIAGDSVEELPENGHRNRLEALEAVGHLGNDVGWNDSSVDDVIQTILQAWWRNRQFNPDSNLTTDLSVNMTSLPDWLVDDLVNTFDRLSSPDKPPGEIYSQLVFDSAPEEDVSKILDLVKPNLTLDHLHDYFDRCAKILAFALALDDEDRPESDALYADVLKSGTLDSATNVTVAPSAEVLKSGTLDSATNVTVAPPADVFKSGTLDSAANVTVAPSADVNSKSMPENAKKSSDNVTGKIPELPSTSDPSKSREEDALNETILNDHDLTGPRITDPERASPEIVNDSVRSRGKRSISPVSGHQRRRFTENRDVLQVDPYQTLNMVYKQGSQPIRVKTGYGFFVTDHYGVRHPYFNNTKLGTILLRMIRFQEAYDFVLLGQPLLKNMTNLSEKDFLTIKKRMDKLMNTNSKRRDNIFQKLFEDFLWLRDNNNKVYRRSIPDSAKLGLPPGHTVAHFTDGQSRNVTLGSREEYGSVPNPPLEMSTEYEIVLAVMSTVADVTKHAWTSVNVTTKPEVPRAVSPIFVILSGAFLTICLFILLLSCFVLWCSKRPRKLGYQDDRFDDLRLEVPPDFISRPVSPLIVSPKRPEPVSPYFSAYPMYPSPPPYPAYPPGQPPGYWTMPLPSPPVPTEGSEGEKAERTDRTKKRKKKKRTKKESEDRVDEEATLPNYIRKVHKPEAHWNRIYDPTGKRYLVDKRANVKNGGRVGPDDRNNISDDDEAETAKGITFRDEFALLADGLNASYNALTDFSRFPHIQLCETTRVFLSPDASSDNTFIHANYIDGCIRGGVSYIAAMSPFNDDTVLDFWRMIYQRKIETIVMMTNVLEGGIVKCAEYWPPCSETVSTLGHFLIQTVSTRSYADYVIRKIKVKSQSSVDCLEVTQFQYTAWPPQGTPASPVTLLDMRYWVRRHHEETRSTHILVHCGTGVSRTAVFVAIDALIDQYEQQGGVNVFKYVSQMRTSRPMMVRSLDHYIFIYTALQDEFEAGDTNIDLEKGIQNAMVSLSQINPNTGQTYLEDQFDLLNYFTLDFLADDVNIVRLLDNRASKTSPVTKRQSSVKPIFVDGYRNRNQFVLMDTPCDEEIADFWRLVCLHNIVSIVQLGKDKSTSRSKKSGRRGGDDRKQRPTTGLTGNYRADTITSKRHDVTLARDILLEEITESGHVVKRKIRHFSIPSRHIVCGGRHKKKHEKKGKKRKEKRKKVRYRGIRNEPRVSRSDYNMSHRSDGNLADEHEYGRGEMCDRKVRVLTPGNGERRSGFYVRGGNFNQKELRDGRTEINVPIQQYTNHIDSRRDYQGTYFKEAGAVPKSDRNDNVAFLVLKDGRLVRTCRNDTKSIHKRPAKHFVSNRQVYSRANTTEHLYVKYPAKYKKCHTSDVRRKNYGAKREHLGTSAGDPANRRLVAKRSSRSESTSRLNRATRHRLLGTSGSMSGRGPGQLSNYRSIALSPGQGSTSRARCSPPQRKRPNAFPDKLRQRYMKMTNSSTNNRNRYIQSIGKLKQFLNPRRLAKLSKQPGQKFTDSLPKSISPEPQRTCQKRRRTTDARAEKTDTCNSAFTTVLPITDCKSLCSCEAAQAKGYICLPTSAPKSPTESKKTQDFYHKSRENSRKPVISEANVRRSKEMFNLEHIDLRSTLAQCSTNTSYSTEGSTSSHNISTSSTGEDTTRSVSIEAPTLTENIQRSSSISKDENESATKTSKLPYRVKLQKKAKDKTKFYQEKVCKKALKPIELLDLNELIWRWQSSPHSDIKQYTAQGPVLIHCPPGKGDASLLCACAQVCEQIQEDQEVDAYHVVKHLRRRYPSAVGSFAEYDFLHRVLFHYVTEYMDDVSLSDRWKNRHRNEQFHRPAIHSGHVIRMRYAGPNTSPPSTPDNTTFNRASSLPSFQGHVQDNLSIVEAPMVSIKGRTQQGVIPWLSPRPPLAIDLSTRPKLQSCEVEMCSGASLTDEANSGEKDLGEVNICSVQESDLGEINICSIQESESGRNKIGPVQEFDGLELSRKKETEQCAENTDLDVSDVILT